MHIVRTAALLAAVVAAAPAFAQSAPPPRIAVTGEGEASVAPDMAVVSLAVLREAATAREALDANNMAMGRVLEAMKASGIADRDLRTEGLQINPRYVYPEPNQPNQQPRIDGYQVTNTLSVRIRDIAKVGEILDKSVTLGVNQGGQIVFTNDDPAAAMTEARKDAVADALDRGRTIAEAAGVRLGRVVEIVENGGMRQPPMPYAMKAMAREQAADSVPVAAGENTYRVSVSVTFELSQP